MTLETIILYGIIAAVLIVIPAVLAKKMGQNPMELLFGERAGRSLFGRKKEASAKTDETGTSDKPRPSGKKEFNSSKNDLLDVISQLATYARKNHFRLLVPGTVTVDGKTAVLTAILVTRSKVVGVNCFGFGGSVKAAPGTSDWRQTLNGVQTTFPSPVKKNQQQRELLGQALESVGMADTDVEIIGVFTSPTVQLSQNSRTNCYNKTGFFSYLQNDRFLNDRGVDPQKVEQALEPMILRAKGKKEEKKEEGKTG